MQALIRFIVKYRLIIVLGGGLAPQLTGCDMLLKLIGLGLVEVNPNNLPYRVVADSSGQTEQERENNYYGAFEPDDDQGSNAGDETGPAPEGTSP